MIDIHCHILPGVDDGAKTIAESIELAKQAQQEGITTIVATPHHHHPSFSNAGHSVIEAVEELNEALKEHDIPVNILPAQEIRIHGEMIGHFETGDLLTYGGHQQYLLVEFPSSQVPRYTKQLFYELRMQEYIPIIAHPERNKVFIEKPDMLYEFVKDGALTQVTTSSLTGHFGKNIKKFSEQLMEFNLTHFIASDAHNLTERTFRMTEALNEAEKLFGYEYVMQLKENAELLIEGQFVYAEPPERIRTRKKWLGIF
ncbi:tyrosine-protein phosphatase [Halalkalibacter sp. APA_J-10(15)]|uniref:tyrosine-protein phosphatase n=1 Tax=unclassified Halalkalibacter TaxID=2893063 RepID=UPI001FF66B02|nr:CpsB/CapC family capsule biosynthesis tyrosine phosphatase [Halalkalibacter sp. APA_J-10(15)]MCK0470082.1 tyrosine protein phosphatase [Halalkalibacter sp. APA_J-10(15)]